MSLKLELFAQLQIIVGDMTITTRLRPRAQRLLAYLLLQRRTPLTRKHIAFSLWPDSTEEVALATLRRALSESRAVLPSTEGILWIIDTRGGLQWNPSGDFWLDVEAFEQLIDQGTTTSLHDAIAIYSGDYLAEWDDE